MGEVLTKGTARGEWWPYRLEGRESAMLRCPSCGLPAFLTAAHRIDDDGAVSPAFACRWAGCHYAAELVLHGWSPRENSESGAQGAGGR